jgi:hypothetical protein
MAGHSVTGDSEDSVGRTVDLKQSFGEWTGDQVHGVQVWRS